MEEKISDESLPQEKVKSRQNQAAQAIEMLKEMIQQGSGRWLASTVIEQDGFLVTSDKALDWIAGEGRISKHLLVGILRSGQHHPLLQIREGKLYLPKKD
jgi:conjugal transfer pilus assembly protein TraI